MTSAIDQLRLEVGQLEAECQMNQAVYDDLVEETKARLDQRI